VARPRFRRMLSLTPTMLGMARQRSRPPGYRTMRGGGNPTSSGAITVFSDTEQPSRIRVSSAYTDLKSRSLWDPCLESVNGLVENSTSHWEEDMGGRNQKHSESLQCAFNFTDDSETEWLPNGKARYRERADGGPWSEWFYTVPFEAEWEFATPPRVPWHHLEPNKVTVPLMPGTPDLQLEYRREAETTIELQTGGRANMKRKNIFAIAAAVWNANASEIQTSQVLPERIVIAGKQVGADGRAYMALPDNTAVDLTPKISGNAGHYHFDVTQTKHSLLLTANSRELSKTVSAAGEIEFCAGSSVTLSAQWQPALPEGTKSFVQWVPESVFVNKILSSGGETNPFTCDLDFSLLTNNPTSVWWVDGGKKAVVCAITNEFSNGQKITSSELAWLTIYRPRITGIANFFDPGVHINTNNYMELRYTDTNGFPHDYSFEVMVESKFRGSMQIVQLINGFYIYDVFPGIEKSAGSTGGQFWLDKSNPHGSAGPQAAAVRSRCRSVIRPPYNACIPTLILT
jgi:hypothetical protein